MAHGWFLDFLGLTSPPDRPAVGCTEDVDYIERIPLPRAKDWHEAALAYRRLLERALDDLEDISSANTTRAWLDCAAQRLRDAQEMRTSLADVGEPA